MFTIEFFNEYDGWVQIATIRGSEAAWEAYKKTCDLARFIGTNCTLLEEETGKTIDVFTGIEEE